LDDVVEDEEMSAEADFDSPLESSALLFGGGGGIEPCFVDASTGLTGSE
jgi:hypothetical protein